MPMPRRTLTQSASRRCSTAAAARAPASPSMILWTRRIRISAALMAPPPTASFTVTALTRPAGSRWWRRAAARCTAPMSQRSRRAAGATRPPTTPRARPRPLPCAASPRQPACRNARSGARAAPTFLPSCRRWPRPNTRVAPSRGRGSKQRSGTGGGAGAGRRPLRGGALPRLRPGAAAPCSELGRCHVPVPESGLGSGAISSGNLALSSWPVSAQSRIDAPLIPRNHSHVP